VWAGASGLQLLDGLFNDVPLYERTTAIALVEPDNRDPGFRVMLADPRQ
jgi:hypothetical protein